MLENDATTYSHKSSAGYCCKPELEEFHNRLSALTQKEGFVVKTVSIQNWRTVTFFRQMKCYSILFCINIMLCIFWTDIWMADGSTAECACHCATSRCSKSSYHKKRAGLDSIGLCFSWQKSYAVPREPDPRQKESFSRDKLFPAEEMTSVSIVLYLFWESPLNSLLLWCPRLPTRHTSRVLQCCCNPSHVNWGTFSVWITGNKDGNFGVIVEAL